MQRNTIINLLYMMLKKWVSKELITGSWYRLTGSDMIDKESIILRENIYCQRLTYLCNQIENKFAIFWIWLDERSDGSFEVLYRNISDIVWRLRILALKLNIWSLSWLFQSDVLFCSKNVVYHASELVWFRS